MPVTLKYKKRLLAMCFACTMIASGAFATNNSPQGFLDLPPVNNLALPNGAKIYYIQDELPQLTIVASIGFGRLYEKKSNAGLADLVARTVSLGGSAHYPGMVLHERIDAIGGILNVESSYENTMISIKVLPRFKDEAFSIMADILTHPNFEESYFANARSLVIDALRRKYDDPFSVAFDKTMEILFCGDGYGAIATEEKLSSYALAMVKDAWRDYFGAKNMLIGISSSIGFDEIQASCQKHFGEIPQGEKKDYAVDVRAVQQRIRESSGKIYFYEKDIPQSTIVMGTLAPSIKDPGYFALSLMNFVLGEGSFNARLMREIRVKRGMAYTTSSIIRFRRNMGVFLAYAQTKSETAGTVLSLIKENVNSMAKEKISPEDIGWSKRSISNSYIFRFETSLDILSNYLEREYYGLPARFFEDYLVNLNKVTDEKVLDQSRRIFQDGFVTCVVGSKEVKNALKKQGEVVEIK